IPSRSQRTVPCDRLELLVICSSLPEPILQISVYQKDALCPSMLHQHDLVRWKIQIQRISGNASPFLLAQFPADHPGLRSQPPYHDEIGKRILNHPDYFHAEHIGAGSCSDLQEVRSYPGITHPLGHTLMGLELQFPVICLDAMLCQPMC